MSPRAWLLSLVLLGACVCVRGEDAPKAEANVAETKTWMGQLAKSEQAQASLKIHSQQKDEKPQILLLFVKQGDAATLKALTDLLATKPLPYATVTGILGQDGKSVQVTSIAQAEPPKKDKKTKK